MKFSESVILNDYVNEARDRFTQAKDRLTEMEAGFTQRMGGRSMPKLYAALIGTALWGVAFIAFAAYIRWSATGILLLLSCLASFGLVAAMLADAILDFSYYGKLEAYRKETGQLQNRLNMGESAILTNHDAFMDAGKKGWNYRLDASPSIPDEAASIESTVSGMEAAKKGFLGKAKTALFFAASVAVMAAAKNVLFSWGYQIIVVCLGDWPSYGMTEFLQWASLAVLVAGAVFFGKLVWSRTECNVTPVTLFALVLTPIAYLILCAALTLLVKLLIWAVSILLTILAVIIGGATVCALSNGG